MYLWAQLIEFAARPAPEALLERIRERKRRTGTTLPGEEIVWELDVDRR